jgi:16S rRNA processing protein RimM
MIENYIQVAVIGKTHSLTGKLNIYFDVEVRNSSFKVLYIKENNKYTPYFISDLEAKGDNGYITFEDVNNKEKAQRLVNCEVFVKEKDFDKYFVELEDDYEDYVGYKAYQGAEYLGIITEIHENAEYQLALVKHLDKEFFIPLVDEMIEIIDEEQQIIEFNIPEGLDSL